MTNKFKILVVLIFLLALNFNYALADQTLQAILTNDPGFTQNQLDIDKQWALAKAGFLQAWNISVGSTSTIVAIIDTGVDATHEDLQNINWVDGYDFVNNKSISGKINSDDNGHGTLVAGILGATVNNGTGIAGTNWKISLMPIKALNASGKGEADNVAKAIMFAADHNAKVINLSIGGIGFVHDTALSQAIAYAFNKNVVMVAAAGNDTATTGGNLDLEPVFPICDDNSNNMIIGVTATDQNDLKPEFANFGKNCIDVSAPGKRILSTINFDPLIKKPAPNSYAYASGTSLAAPFVSGQAALLRTAFPYESNINIRDRIILSADPIDEQNLSQCDGGSCRGLLGSGRINVYKSLTAEIAKKTAGLNEGDLVKTTDTNLSYYISGGQKHLVSPFVQDQRFANFSIKKISSGDLAVFPDGAYALPQEGTLVKIDSDPTVYYIYNGKKMPVLSWVFSQRNFSMNNIKTVSYSEFITWSIGNFLSPVDGSLLKAAKNKTIFWVVGDTLHPINYNFYLEKGLNNFRVLTVKDADINGFAKGEAYVR